MFQLKQVSVIICVLFLFLVSFICIDSVTASDPDEMAVDISRAEQALNVPGFNSGSVFDFGISDAVNLYNGNLIVSATDLSLPGRNGLGVSITRQYNSNIFAHINQYKFTSRGCTSCCDTSGDVICPDCVVADYLLSKGMDTKISNTDGSGIPYDSSICSLSGDQEPTRWQTAGPIGRGWTMGGTGTGKIQSPNQLFYNILSEGDPTTFNVPMKGVTSISMTLGTGNVPLFLPASYPPLKQNFQWDTDMQYTDMFYEMQHPDTNLILDNAYYGDGYYTMFTDDLSAVHIQHMPKPITDTQNPLYNTFQGKTYQGQPVWAQYFDRAGTRYVFSQYVPFCSKYDDIRRREDPNHDEMWDLCRYYNTYPADKPDFVWAENPYAGLYLTDIIDSSGNTIRIYYTEAKHYTDGTECNQNERPALQLLDPIGKTCYGSPFIDKIVDTAGREIEFYYNVPKTQLDKDSKIVAISYPNFDGTDGSEVEGTYAETVYINYGYNSDGLLASVGLSDHNCQGSTSCTYLLSTPPTTYQYDAASQELVGVSYPSGAQVDYEYVWKNNIPAYNYELTPSDFSDQLERDKNEFERRVIKKKTVTDVDGTESTWDYYYHITYDENSPEKYLMQAAVRNPTTHPEDIGLGSVVEHVFIPAVVNPRFESANHVGTDPLSRNVRSDWSFRSGLELRTNYYKGVAQGDIDENSDPQSPNYWIKNNPQGEPLPQDLWMVVENIWSGYRPFDDPIYNTIGDMNYVNVAWKTFVNPNPYDGFFYSGDIQRHMTVIPRLEATVTKKYGFNSAEAPKIFLQRFYYDEFSNPVKTVDYGLIDSYEKTYEDQTYHYIIPTGGTSGMTLNSILTDFAGTLSITDNTVAYDKTTTETKYLYEGIDPSCVLTSICGGGWQGILYKYLENNFYSLPELVTTKNWLGKTLSRREYQFDRFRQDLFYETYYGLLDKMCYRPTGTQINNDVNPAYFYNCWSEDEWCVRGYLRTIIDYAVLGDSLKMAERNIPWSKWTYVDRDTCGNPVYISEMGQSYDSRGDSSYYKMEQTSKSIVTDYDNTYSISPQQIELLGIPIFTTTANTYEYGKIMGVTDKTGFTTNIRYDTLGRIKKAWSDLQSESDPAAEYTYYTPAGGSRWKVYEKVKSGNGYMESYHIYDGLGRWIQTQTLDVDGGIIVTGTKYNQNGGKAYDYKPTKFMSAFGTYIDLEAQGVEKNQYFYDSLDRPIWVFGYDVDDWLQAWQTTGNYVDTQYYISDTSDSITASYTEVYDQNNPKSGGSYIDPNPYIAYQDSRGQLIKVKEPLK